MAADDFCLIAGILTFKKIKCLLIINDDVKWVTLHSVMIVLKTTIHEKHDMDSGHKCYYFNQQNIIF